MSKCRVLGIVGARLNSSRLPGKHLLDLAGKPLIARIFERLEQIVELDAIVLATTADDYNLPLVQWAQQAGKALFAYDGDVNDVVGRVDAIVKQYQPQIVVYFCGDSPLIEPQVAARLINVLLAVPQADLVELRSSGSERRSIHEGFMPWPINTWQRLVALATEVSEREHVGSSLKKATRLTKIYVTDDEVFSRIEQRISVDTPSDYQFMATVYQRWYTHNPPHSIVSLSWVIDQLLADESLSLMNQQVRQKGVNDRSAKIVLLTHCGESIGLGHLRRAMVLARALQDRHSAAVELLIVGDAVALAGLELLPHRFIVANGGSDQLAQQLMGCHPEAVVIDVATDRLNIDFGMLLASLRQQQIVTVAIDALIEQHELLDLIFIPSFYLAPEQRVLVGQEKILFGWDNYFFDPVLQPRPWSGGSKVIVMTGGSDHYGLGALWPIMLDGALPAGTIITWITGLYANAPEVPANPRLTWQVEHAPDNLAQLMAQADYALTPYGVTLFELLKLAKPVVAYHPDSSQQPEMAAFIAAEVARLAMTPAGAVAALVTLMSDARAARELVKNATQRIAGSNGGIKLAASVMGLLERRL
ncbi:MAG: hypothetical protein U1B30_12265 [Pseudomonadota bacterium]|nr:hypothetical protein [Pseudomonadota bacterium]